MYKNITKFNKFIINFYNLNSMRGIDKKNILDQFVIDFCKVVEKHCKYIIVSGFVVISSGRTRATEDIDMIIERTDINISNHISH